MVIDKVNGLSIPRYLVYDIVKYEGRDIGQEPFFPNRLACIQKQITGETHRLQLKKILVPFRHSYVLTEPRNNAMGHGWIIKDREPFSVRLKSFWEVTQAGALLAPKFANSLAHEPDGLIFQPSKDVSFFRSQLFSNWNYLLRSFKGVTPVFVVILRAGLLHRKGMATKKVLQFCSPRFSVSLEQKQYAFLLKNGIPSPRFLSNDARVPQNCEC